MKLPEKLWPYLYIACALVTIFIIVIGSLTPQRVGDGGEYYALFYAWQETLKPWMTPISFDAYERLYASNKILGLVPREFLENAFPCLKIGATWDFNHFWFYSFLAFIIAKILSLFGIIIEAHNSFLLLHFLFLFFSVTVSYYFYKWKGVVAFSIMTIASPMLWFFDKVHAELFVYCLVLSAVIFIYSKRYLPGSFLLALASTQNPSFAIVATIPFIYSFVAQRASRYYNFVEILLIAGTPLAILAHPVYYFLRFVVPTPQLLAGGASLGGNLSSFYIWLLDPDLGLLPNWPLGSMFILVAIALFFFSKNKKNLLSNKPFLLFFASFLLINLYAHSSTTNLNSGATPGLARYALWYLPLLFPVILYVLDRFPAKKVISYPLIATAAIISIFSIVNNNPKKHEQYQKPSYLSRFIQTKLPLLYNPPPEVFAERFSGCGEKINSLNPRGILGPDCRKLLIYSGPNRTIVTAPAHCTIDKGKLNLFAESITSGVQKEFYKYIDDEEFGRLQQFPLCPVTQ